MFSRRYCLVATVLFASVTAAQADNWPQFRGPTGAGITADKNLPIKWGGKNHENVLWTADRVGEGGASPIVWGDRLFVCSVKLPANAAGQFVIPDHHVVCYRTSDGKLLWDTKVPPGLWTRNGYRGEVSEDYSAPTPCTDGKHVFVAFGSSVLAALDFDGRITWRNPIEPHTFDITLGSSPILYKDTVILLCALAAKTDSRIVAFDVATGAQKWETKLPTTGFAHSTPLIVDIHGKSQLLTLASGMDVTPDGLQSFDPATGTRLWWCRAGGDTASPVYGDRIVYIDSGRGGPGFAVDPTGAGDVSKTNVKWTIPQIPESLGSAIVSGGYVYRLHSPSILKCWKSDTGEQVYSHKLDGLSTNWASPILDGAGHLIFANGGKSAVVKSGPEFEVLTVNDLEDANYASGAVANGKLFIVGTKKIYCVGVK